MLVLHANWKGGRLWLWGETTPRGPSPDPSLSPFSLTPAQLVGVVRTLCGGARRPWLRARHVRPATARLPSFKGRPAPSRALLLPAGWPLPPEGPLETAQAFVNALPLSFGEAAALFASVVSSGNRSPASLVAVGDDLAALARVWRFAGAALARQRVLPGIVNGLGRWLPALDAADAARRDALLAAVPPAAWCLDGAASPATFFADAVDAQTRAAASTRLTRIHARRAAFSDLHSAWMASLRAPDPAIRWPRRDEIDALAVELANWRRSAVYAAGGGATLGFRVVDPLEPGAATPLWTLLPVAIADGKAHPLEPAFLAGLAPSGRRDLLMALGQAAALAPELPEESFGESSAGGATRLDAAALHAFLKDTAPRLRAAGFAVLAPAWWTPAGQGGRGRVSVRARAVRFREGSGLFSLDSLIDVDWEILLDGTGVNPRELEWLLAHDSPVVRLGDRWVASAAPELRAARDLVARLSREPVSLRSLVQLGLGASTRGVAVEVDPAVLPSGAEGVGSLLDGAARMRRVPVPAGFHGSLRDYQRRGLDWLAFLQSCRFGACLADDMGLGKTVEALSAFLRAREEGIEGPALVVCPTSILLKWSREAASFAPTLRTWICHGPDRPRGEAFRTAAAAHDICITSYQTLCSDLADMKAVRWGVVALDEAQNIKNPRTAKSRAARALSAVWRLALTGTPVENGVGDLWAIMDFLNPGLLLGQDAFEERFRRPIATGSDPAARAELRRLTAPFILRRLKDDPEVSAGLPPKVEEKVYCGLTREQAELYAAEVRDAEQGMPERRGLARRGAVLALLTRLKQICNHPVQYLAAGGAEGGGDVDPARSGKLARLDEMLDEVLAAGECALVFTQYAAMGALLARHISARLGFDVPFLHGGVPVRRRDEMVARFQRPDGPPVFVLSIKAGGIGLDLTRANHVFHFDRWWNPAVESQATDRAHRIGQGKTVFVHTFICEGTLESHIDDLISGKVELARDLVASGDAWLASLDGERLHEIVALSDDYASPFSHP